METITKPKPPTTYTCKECGLAVAVVNGEVIRACPHATAGITAHLTATAYGESKVAGENKK